MKTQVQIKNGKIESHEFIDFIADLIELSYISHFSLSNTYVSDRKREYNSFRLVKWGVPSHVRTAKVS